MKKTEEKPEIDVNGLNTIISLSKKLLKIGYVLIVILAVYGFLILGRETGIFKMLLTLLKIMSPLFIGIVIAWLFNPVVKWLGKKGIRRGLATILVYAVLISLLALIIGTLIPILYEEVNDFVKVIPAIFDSIEEWLTKILDGIDAVDMTSFKESIFDSVAKFSANIAASLPSTIGSIITTIFSGMSTIAVGLIIGFFMLLSFDTNEATLGFLPQKAKIMVRDLSNVINNALRTFVSGALLDSAFVFIISSIGLYFVGLRAPLLFGLFCGITNVIPYAGPYIGGAPAIIVGFSQGTTTGLLTLAVIMVIQFLEGNFIQPVIMSKTTKLHPVTIIIGLLIFGHFWGILGMLIATPFIAAVKAVLLFLNEKYAILKIN